MLAVRKFLVPTLAMLILVPAFTALGFWQLDRAQEKRALQSLYDRRATQAPVALGAETGPPQALQYRHLRIRGHYETDYRLLWDNRIHHGIAGYHVITPFRIEGSDTRVLVNRGWVPMGADRQHPPDTEPPSGTVTITGVAVVPQREFTLGQLDPLRRTRLTVWQELDLARYARQTGWPLQPVVILLDPQSPGGYVREWARLDTGVAIHEGYAFQWFMFAAVTLGVYIALTVRAIRRARASAGVGAK